MSDNIEKSLTDLPPELIELIGDYLKPTEVKALRSVNKYCHNVFSSDKYWKSRLYHTEKYFICDLKSQSTVPGISEVVEEITEGRVSKWLGYLKLQNTHLNNWACGRKKVTYKIFPLKNDDYKVHWMVQFIYNRCDMKDIVDDYNENWLFVYGYNMVHVWNITAKPRPIEPFKIYNFYGMTLSPQGKVLFKKIEGGRICFYVYSFDNTASTLKFVHKLDVYVNFGIYNCNFLVCDKLIYFPPNKKSAECILKIWDWHLGHQVATICLFKEELYQDFQTRNGIKSTSKLRITFYEATFPNVMIFLVYENLARATIFNLETRKLTHVVDTFIDKGFFCEMKWNKIFLYNGHTSSGWNRVSMYSFTCNKVKHLANIGSIYNERLIISKTKIIFKNTQHSIKIIDTTEDLELLYSFSVWSSVTPVGFIEPSLLLIKCENILKVFSTSSENKLLTDKCCLLSIVLGSGVHIDNHMEIPTCPSKLILRDVKEGAVFIYTF